MSDLFWIVFSIVSAFTVGSIIGWAIGYEWGKETK